MEKKLTHEGIIEVLKKYSIEMTFADEAKSWIIPNDAFNLIASELESLQEESKDESRMSADAIKQKCEHCGNEYYKELHCRECGNNFLFNGQFASQGKDVTDEQTCNVLLFTFRDYWKKSNHQNIEDAISGFCHIYAKYI